MCVMPRSTALRSTASAASRSRGGPKTPGPASCIAPNPTRPTGRPPNMDVIGVVMRQPCATVPRATRRASIVGPAPPPSETRRAELAEFLKHRRSLASPAYLIGPRTDVLAWNSAAARVLGEPQAAPDGRPNLLWWLFARDEPRSEQTHETARNTLARFRAEHARRIGDPDFAALIDALEAASADFRAWWPRHEVLTEQLGTKTIDHPELGTLLLHHLQSVPTSHPDLRLTQFAPADDATRATLQAMTDPG